MRLNTEYPNGVRLFGHMITAMHALRTGDQMSLIKLTQTASHLILHAGRADLKMSNVLRDLSSVLPMPVRTRARLLPVQYRRAALPKASAASSIVLVIEDERPDPINMRAMVDRYYPSLTDVKLVFVGNMPEPRQLDFVTKFFKNNLEGQICSLLNDYTPNDSSNIRDIVGGSYVIAEQIGEFVRRQLTGIRRDHFTFFHEPILLALEDRYYRHLRLLKAFDLFLADCDADEVLGIGIAGGYLPALLSIAMRHFDSRAVRVSTFGASVQGLDHCLSGIVSAGKITPQLPQSSRLVEFTTPLPFVSERFGPVRPLPNDIGVVGTPTLAPEAFVARIKQMAEATANLKAAYEQMSDAEVDDAFTQCPVAVYGDQGVDVDEPWLCLIVNLEERVYGSLAWELLRHYLPRSKVLIIDHTPERSPILDRVKSELFATARCCRVYNFLSLAHKMEAPGGLADRVPLKGFSAIHRAIWPEIDILVDCEPFIEAMRPADGHANSKAIVHHLRVAYSSLMVFRRYAVRGVVVLPTRNTHMRVGAQAARLFGVPTIEAQTMLGGKMLRHRGPNSDQCAVLDTWSRDYYQHYFGYPAEHVRVLGSLRFDNFMANLEANRDERESLKETLFPGAPEGFPLVMFGTQPLDAERNLHCLKLVIEACKDIDECRVVVKLHPAESQSKAKAYSELAVSLMPADRVAVLTDVNLAALMAVSNLVVAQSSNILLEAAYLDRRACSLHFSANEPPISFGEMGVAEEIRHESRVAIKLKQLLTIPAGSHPVDQSRRAYVEMNPQLAHGGYLERLVQAIDEMQVVDLAIEQVMEADVARTEHFAAGVVAPVRARRQPVMRAFDAQTPVNSLADFVTAFQGGPGANFYRFRQFVNKLSSERRTMLASELAGALAQQSAASITHLVLSMHLALESVDVRQLAAFMAQVDDLVRAGMSTSKREAVHLGTFAFFRPVAITSAAAYFRDNEEGYVPAPSRPDIRRLLVLTEGDIDPEVALDYVGRSFPNAEAVTISFLSRPNNVVDRFQDELLPRTDRRYAFIDLLADYTGNYMPSINSCVGASYVQGDAVCDVALRDVSGPLQHVLGFLREPLTQGIEDHYYRYLRTLKAASVLFEANPADALLLVAATGTNVASVSAMAQRHFSRDDIFVSVPARRITQFEHVVEQIRQCTAEAAAAPEPIEPSPLADFRPPPPFCSFVHGPIRPALDADTLLPLSGQDAYRDRYADMQAHAEQLAAYVGGLGKADTDAWLVTVPVARYGSDDNGDDPWVLLAVNFNDRVHATLYEDLISHYARDTRLILFDFSELGGAAYAGVEERQFGNARYVEVYKYREILRGLSLPPELTFPATALEIGHLHPMIHRNAGIGINFADLDGVLNQADSRTGSGMMPSHLAVAFGVIALVNGRNVAKAVACPTRSSLMRMVAQTARLFKIPTLEAQTVLNGRMVRHRAPSTDYCSVLETWSRDYYADFFGYPRERLLLGGALRYDRIVEGVENDAARETIANLRETLFPGSGNAPLVVFGTQPMQMSDNLFFIERLLEACLQVPETRVVIKVHPAESESNRRAYERVGKKLFPEDRLLVTKDVDTYHLMMAANLTASQTSNILLEAGFLDCRAVSLHFGAYHPPVDFEEMNAAMIIKDPAVLPEIVRDLLTAPPGTHWFDARRRHFIDENPQLVDRQYRRRIVSFLDLLDGWKDGYEAMVADDQARLEAFDPATCGWRL
ncbi:MAG TPA: hypothetical protein VK196_05275 [Magnetospirillum sp.]|nr:hypothetical protein [Magnetospirillum sp.]